jgi:hypothetical protein
MGVENANLDSMEDFVNRNLGKPYAYFKALRLGVSTILGLNDNSSPLKRTPNGQVYSGSFYLVDHI